MFLSVQLLCAVVDQSFQKSIVDFAMKILDEILIPPAVVKPEEASEDYVAREVAALKVKLDNTQNSTNLGDTTVESSTKVDRTCVVTDSIKAVTYSD